MSNAWFNSRMFGNGVVSKKDLFELMMRHKPIDNGDGSKERYAYIEWLGIYHAIRELPSADRPQGEVDAIDRDALIDYCLKLIDVERKQGSDVMNYGQERVNQTEAIIDYIEHMPHVNADRPQEWIPCSERLPEENTEVLMSLEWGIDIGEYRNGDWHSEWINHYDDGNVLAWMPLPKPWKGADDE